MTDITAGQSHCVVTGGAGFIGSHLVDFLIDELCHDVTVIDDLSTGRLSNLDGHMHRKPAQSPCVRVIEAGVEEGLEIAGKGRPADFIFHLAAGVGVDLVLARSGEMIMSSTRNCSAVLDAARRWNARTLLASSSEVYGKSCEMPFREDGDVTYGPTTITRWSYAYAKALDEFAGLDMCRRFGVHISIARFFNTVGPRQLGRYGMVLPRFVAAAMKNEPLRVFGSGAQSRCFCDVRDVVRALPALLANDQASGMVCNVGSECSIRIVDLAQLVIRTLNSSSTIAFIPYDRAYGPGFEDVDARQPSLDRIRSLAGFHQEYPLERTISDLAESMGMI